MKQHILLVGGGIWGRNILRDLVALRARVTVVEPRPERESELLETGAAAVTRSLPETGAGYDGVIVASPSVTHRAVLEAVRGYDLPIFVEKPLTTSLADAEALAGWGSGRIFLMHVWRYHAGIRLLGEVARTQVLGEVKGLRTTRANWTSPRTDTDSVWNLLPHDLTIAREILGHVPAPRAALVEEHAGISRGMVALLGGKPWLAVEVSNRYERKLREVRLHCARGVAVLADEKVDHLTLYHGDDRTPPGEVREERLPFSGPSPLQRELREFLGYLAGGPAPRCDFAEGLEVVRIIDRLRRLATLAG